MQLDHHYTKYIAEEATGGLPYAWEETVVPSLPAEVSGDDGEKPMFTFGRFSQEPRPVAAVWRSMTPTILSDYIVVVKTTNGTDATMINLANVRQAAPIFKESTMRKFEKLVAKWKADRNQISSGTEMFLHPEYQKIIGMGPEVVPLILKEVEANPDHWFWALKAITGKDPVPSAHRGRLKLMTEDWINWARNQSYQW